MAQLSDLVGNEIAEMADLFKRTSNPAAAWRAYSLAQTYSRAIPFVVQAEINRFAACVSEAAGKVIQIETDLASVTAAEKQKKPRSNAKKTNTPKDDRPIVSFRATQLYLAWRGTGYENPIKQLQNDWRDYRIFLAIQKHVENDVKPGKAREIVRGSSYVTLGEHAIEKIWKRLKTKRQQKTP